MRWCARRGFRRVCLSLAFVLVFLHLLLTLHSLAVEPPACQPLSPPGGLSLRGLAPTELLEETPMVPGSEAYSSDSPAGRHSARAAPSGNPLRRKSPPAEEWGGNGSVRVEALAGPRTHQPSQLEALFSHGLYNLPSPPVPEDDWLLRMKPKAMASEKSSQLWVSASENVYEEIRWNSSTDSHPPWLRFHLGISRWQLYPHRDPNMVQLSRQLASHRIVSAVQKSGGTQLKLVMSFPNYGQALFKPMKQERDEETNFNLYYFSDFERHNAEIAAFHLDGVLGYRRVPPVVGRLVDVVKEIKDVTTDPRLAKTFFTSPVGNKCFYGVCSYYCSTEHAVCGRPRALEGSLAAMLPDDALAKRKSWRSPWRRSYSRSKLAEWETNPDFCTKVKKSPPYDQGTRLLDLIDMAVLDFLMSNMDRHHYETFEKFGNDTFLIHLDNGRAFGRHSKDEPSILAPLKQCCRIRRSTWLRLLLLSRPQYRLSDVMREALSQDPLAGVATLLSEPHLAALDRRLATVLRAVRRCQKRHDHRGGEGVIHDDIPHYQSGVTPSP